MRLTIGVPQFGQSGEAVLADAGLRVGLAAASARGDAGVILVKSMFCTSRIIPSSASPWISSMGLPCANRRASGVKSPTATILTASAP